MQPSPVLQRAIKRLALTTKQAGKDYYKGTGTGAMGRHTKWGGYIIDPAKVRTYRCPDLSDFSLTPFVAKRIEPRRDTRAQGESPVDGNAWLRMWKEAGGQN